MNHDFVQNFPATAGTQRHRDGMNIKHCKNVFIAKLGAAAGIRSYRGNTITAGRDRNWDLGSCQLSAPGLQQTACRVSPAGSSGEVTPDGPGPAALQRCPCQETGRCPTACSIRSSPAAPLQTAACSPVPVSRLAGGRGVYIDSAGVDI